MLTYEEARRRSDSNVRNDLSPKRQKNGKIGLRKGSIISHAQKRPTASLLLGAKMRKLCIFAPNSKLLLGAFVARIRADENRYIEVLDEIPLFPPQNIYDCRNSVRKMCKNTKTQKRPTSGDIILF